jgi:hypothetical protein
MAAGEFEVLFGGAKGPGKSDCILMGALHQVEEERYKALILRETFGELQDLVDRSHMYFPKLAAKPHWNGELKRWQFPNRSYNSPTGAGGGIVQFHYCRRKEDVTAVQGKEWAYIGYDELGKVPDEQVWILLSAEVRCPNPRVLWRMRASANPGQSGHGWLKRRFVKPCGIDGSRILVRKVTLPNGAVSRITRRYIPARVTDNPVYANDPVYMAQLFTLPEVLRKQLLYGDWDAGYGQALAELDEGIHIVRPFEVPEHWTQFGSFDWGFAHNWVFVWWAADEDGSLWVLDTVRGRRHLVHDIAGRIKSRVPVEQLRYIHAGHDIRGKGVGARDDNTPTLQEEFMEYGIVMGLANTDRKLGLMNARHYVAYKGIGYEGEDSDPGMRFFDTPGNQWLFAQLQDMVVDEDDMEDVLKVDADPMTGQGGDDGYDAWRYGLASRPQRAIGLFSQGVVRAFSQQSLQYEIEHKYRDKAMPQGQQPFGPAGRTGLGEYGAGF